MGNKEHCRWQQERRNRKKLRGIPYQQIEYE